MAETAIGRALAPVIPFDPVTWLVQFRAASGYVTTVDDQPALGAIEPTGTGTEPHSALAMLNDAWSDPATRASIRNHLLANAGGDHGID